VQGAIAPGQEPAVADHWPAAAPTASSFLARKEGMAAIKSEIAEAVGISIKGVEKQIERGIKAMRLELLGP